MNNLLQQAIDCNDGDRAVKIIQDALGIESDDVANYLLPAKPGRPGASGAPALSANGCEARHAFWPHGHEKATACLARKQLDFEVQRRIVAAQLWHFDIFDGIPRQADLAVKSTAADQFRFSD